ncbi:MAG: hypothetical protein IJ511_05270 [Bacteroides sp.]|nr:hypothetical protein [Bacteroides sp.]
MKSTEAYNAHHGAASTLFLSLCLLLTLCLAGACSDDYDDAAPAPRQGMVTLSLPGVLTRAATDTDDNGATYIPVENGGTNEGAINAEKGLWFFAFPVKNGNNDTDYNPDNFYSADILSRLSETDGNNHRQLQIPLPYGTYHFYLAGNIAGLQHVRSEQALQQIYLAYTQGTNNHLYVGSNGGELKAGNLPMFRDGAPLEVTINDQTGNTTPVADMHLTFLCAKVTLNMQMAPGTTTASSSLQKLHLSHLAQTSPVVLLNYLDEANNGKVFANDADYKEFSPKRKEECPNGYLAANRIAIPASPVADSEDNGSQRPSNAVPLMDGTNPISIPAANAQKALVATFYLPEYYVKASDSTTDYIKDANGSSRTPSKIHLTVDGTLYTLPLGGLATTEYTGSNADGLIAQSKFPGGNLVRGTHYDLTAYVPDPGEEWTLTVTPYAWNTRTLNTAFRETELWVEETETTDVIAPFVLDEIRYTTNAAHLSAVCMNTINDQNGNAQPILLPTFGNNAEGETVLRLEFNPALTYQNFEDQVTNNENYSVAYENGRTCYKGTADVQIKANNITKVIRVNFSMYEVFEVTPLSITLNTAGATGTYICRTNLGTPAISNAEDETDETSHYSLSNVELQKDGTYKITVTAETMPQTSVTHNFTLTATGNTPARIKNSESLSVTLLPSGYVVHFAAINSILKEESCHALPFCDGWEANDAIQDATKNSDVKYPQTLVSRQAFMAQLETTSSTTYKIANYHSWLPKVTAKINNNNEKPMTLRENTNRLWYDLALTEADNTPGTTTLKFFSDADNTSYFLYTGGFEANRKVLYSDDTPIRYPYYQSDNLKLFHHNNKEGWIVADPTTLKMEWLTEEPTIVTVKYVVDVVCPEGEEALGMRWYLNYGQVSGNLGQFLIQSEQDTNKAYQNIKAYKVNGSTYRFTFYLESVAKNTAKDISLMVRTRTGTIELGKLFGGQDFQNGSYEGAYDPMTGSNESVSIVASGTYDCNTGMWSQGVTGESGSEISADDFTLPELEKNSAYFRIYFYRPMEPAAWNMTGGPYRDSNNNIMGGNATNVYIHMAINDWGNTNTHDKKKNLKLLPYNYRNNSITQNKMLERWHFIDMNDGNWRNYDEKNLDAINTAQIQDYHNKSYTDGKFESNYGEFIAMFRNDTWREEDDKNQTDGTNGYVYKSDIWSWSNAYNNYFADFRVNGHGYQRTGYINIQNNAALHYMDRKAFKTRPR